MPDSDIVDKTQRLLQLMEKHLGARGKTLEAAVRRAGRQLPKGLRVKAQVLIEAQKMSAHPKLTRRIDHEEVASAFTALETHLKQIDLAEQRKTRALNIAAGLAMNVLLIGIALLIILRWRGLV